MTRTIVDVSILQTVPPSNVNRDDTGSPKTAIYGGVRRARVSSQAWKRATRKAFSELLDRSELGVRTKRVVELLGERIREQEPEIAVERAQELAKEVFEAAGFKLAKPRRATAENPLPEESDYLLFLSSRQLARLAEIALAAQESDDPKSVFKEAGLKKALDTEHSVDLALFGRMVADSSDLNVDAAVQVAHAISVHPVENEFDYYTAVDDHKAGDDEEDAGAAMIGTVEFNSSTLYRYATIDLDRLLDNLGDPVATRRALEAFLRAFARSMPTGKQNTFANRTLPDAVILSVRDSQPVNLVGAFEEAVRESVEGGRLRRASESLAAYAQSVDATYATSPIASWVVRVSDAAAALDALGARASFDDAVDAVGEVVASRLAETR